MNSLFLGDSKALELPTCIPVSTVGDVITLTVNAKQDKVKNWKLFYLCNQAKVLLCDWSIFLSVTHSSFNGLLSTSSNVSK